MGPYLLSPTTKLSVMFGSYDGFFQIPNHPRQTPNPEYLAGLGIAGVDSATLNERQSETNRYGIVALQSSVGSDINYQIAYFIRDTTIDFTPDNMGDLALRRGRVETTPRRHQQRFAGRRQLSSERLPYDPRGLFRIHGKCRERQHLLGFPCSASGNIIRRSLQCQG